MSETATNESRLGGYLKDRRTKLDPAAFGFAAERRRTPGLRREEVAQRANISPTWYTWLEQGRGGAPSADVLNRISRALMLTEVEREHLFLLGLGRPPEARYRKDDGATPRLQRVLDALDPSPALIRNAKYDVVAWNRAATVMLVDYGSLPPEQRNILRFIFLDPRARAAQYDWASVARFVLGAFRVDAARAGAAAEVEPLVEELCRLSPEFKAMWRDNDVPDPPWRGGQAYPAPGARSARLRIFDVRRRWANRPCHGGLQSGDARGRRTDQVAACVTAPPRKRERRSVQNFTGSRPRSLAGGSGRYSTSRGSDPARARPETVKWPNSTTPKTIVITGASSGIGKATARLFLDKGWNVVATMRNPATEKDLTEQARLKLIALDVQDPEGPKAAVAEAIKAYGRIDVWLNNAGYGAFGPVEAGRRKEIERQFDVNVFGLIACVQAVAPHFRERKAGVLINISSIGGIMTVPAYAVYNSTKFAVEGLSEGLWYELGTFGIKVKVIEPGAIKTDFGGRSQDVWDVSRVPDYAPFMDKVKVARERYIQNSSSPETVAEVIYRAATDPSDRMRYSAGADAGRLIPLRRLLGSRVTMKMIKRRFGL